MEIQFENGSNRKIIKIKGFSLCDISCLKRKFLECKFKCTKIIILRKNNKMYLLGVVIKILKYIYIK